MSSTGDVVLGAPASTTQTTVDKKKKKRTGRIAKKRLHIFMDHSKLAFNRWETWPNHGTSRIVRHS
jgi:hypothetical protein